MCIHLSSTLCFFLKWVWHNKTYENLQSKNTWHIHRHETKSKFSRIMCGGISWMKLNQDSWIKIDQLMSLALFFAQHVSNARTFIFRSLRLCVGILLWFDVCWSYGVVRLGWCGIVMQAEALQCLSLHNDTTSPQPNHTVTPTHIEPEQYTHTQSQAPEDECTSIRNMLSKK
jgi:hypothetical protein